jgi:protein-tyrosine phosphatase
MESPVSVLFVCLGNICRSPLAEAAFHIASDDLGLTVEIDSAGTGDWHIGLEPDYRSIITAAKYGLDISHYRARQVQPEDFLHFSHIVAMDSTNLRVLKSLAPEDSIASLSLLLDHVEGREGQSIADPYHGGPEGFEITWADVKSGAFALAQKLSQSESSTFPHSEGRKQMSASSRPVGL